MNRPSPRCIVSPAILPSDIQPNLEGDLLVICVAVTYLMRPGHEEEAVKLFAPLSEATRAELGCRMYLVHRSGSNPRIFFLYEQYEDQAALDAHRAAPHFEKYVKNGLFTILESRSPELYELLNL